ncbi:DMT family transporter [Campylobacter fetus]|uniref:DMT family transporter n=1 Tax=Campylobacter fetus TaxID=196 RepID=UPI0003C29B9D|nr:SMR family transporter [Campylobacter fetus]AGZ82147.1 multidrug efflux system protein, EmrE family [Campylobacter fetus subsp. testudinum 03-427]OCS09694.1 multidrug transporter [Campylobacter fetus subsp. testudinum]OCS12155.1 multidrug transporter [Campylobacter fetus subsp. testudinum]OCS13208.1 multidrug transporter [Campylobacter fetus subsp. testudinum]UEA65828.1 multidrug transporter [Campylobacter fetus subsp. testudinum]
MIHFLALILAGGFEVLGVVFLNKYGHSSGIKKIINFLFIVITFACSLSLLRFAMQSLSMSVSYAIWTGIGAIGAVGVGVFINKEKLGFKKLFYLFLIIFSVIMLKII